MANYPSTGESAAVGFERGIGIGRGLREDEERRKERQQELGLRTRQLDQQEEERTFQRGRQTKVDTMAEEDRAMKALDASVASARDEFGGLWQTGVRDDRLTAAGTKLEQLGAQRSAAMRKRYAPLVQQDDDKSKALLSDLASHKKTPDQVPESDLYHAMSVGLKRPVSDLFRAEDGTPSPLAAAAEALPKAIESGDERSMLQAANVVYSPMLKVGVGEVGRGGAEVVKKEIVAVRADPRGNGKVMPTLLVTVKLPNGQEAQYHAPMTEGRSSHGDDDRVLTMDVGNVLDTVARIQAAEKVVNSPQAAEYLRRGEQTAAPNVDRYLNAYYASGGKEFKPKDIKTEVVDQGGLGKTRIKTGPGGEETRETFPVTATPGKELDNETKLAIAELRAAERASRAGGAGGAGAEEKRMRVIMDYAKQNKITPEEAAKKLRELSVLGVQSPEEKQASDERKAATAATERDVAAAQRNAPGTSPAQVRLESELKAKALRDKSMPAGAKLGKYVVGKGLQVMDDKGKQIGWYKE